MAKKTKKSKKAHKGKKAKMSKKQRAAQSRKARAGTRAKKHTRRGCGRGKWRRGGNAYWRCKPGAKRHYYK